jgi:hypothetical protein
MINMQYLHENLLDFELAFTRRSNLWNVAEAQCSLSERGLMGSGQSGIKRRSQKSHTKLHLIWVMLAVPFSGPFCRGLYPN